ncbi:MAG: type II toxin-antitoxin system VapC family toxin [Planctomycetota bacterium]|nr:type II toxin-antitoxin system VapC family toxin [Planctomycetota bacterium]
MKTVVVDASVAAKWFLPEPEAAAAVRLLDGRRRLVAPDLICTEVGNIFWKLCTRKLLAADEAAEMLDHFLSMPLGIHDSALLLPAALEIAVATCRTVYDSLYLALAVELGATVVTADRCWANALNPGPFTRFLRPLATR